MFATMNLSDSINQRSWGSKLWAYSYRHAEALFPAEQAILADHADELAKAWLLDLGIGTGRTTQALARRVASYVGVDYSPAMIERAKVRCPGLDLRVGDARNLTEFGDQSFEAVLFSFNGIDYVDHTGRLAVLAEIARVLKPGGLFVFASHNRAVRVPAAWDPVNLRPSWHPVRFARNCAGFVHGIANHVRLQRHALETTDYALRNDAANHYGLLTYYIDAAAQARQLANAGFVDSAVYDQSGRAIAAATDAPGYMLHYVARRG